VYVVGNKREAMVMRYRIGLVALLASAALAGCGDQPRDEVGSNVSEASSSAEDFILEGYPDEVAASLDRYDQALANAAEAITDNNAALSSVIARQDLWPSGSVVQVAFNGGNPELYARIERAAQQWTQPGLANVQLSFRDDEGRFRKWTAQDTQYAAQIRIGFNPTGYWSLIGMDSVDRMIVGGGPGQQSMNFQLSEQGLPADFDGTVTHEFGHGLGFLHEHQSPGIECGFRFDDDPGYVPLQDARRRYIDNPAGKRPGLYTSLSGYPNFWNRAKVDRNLKRLQPSSGIIVGPYDRLSIMEYFFKPAMFVEGDRSPCYIEHENNLLSQQDRTAVAQVYPANDALAGRLERRVEADTLALAKAAPDQGTLDKSLKARLAYRRSAVD
jgi:hypothetical protein